MVCDISPTHKILKYAEFQPAFPYNNTSNGVTLVDYHEHSARNNHQIKAGKWNLFRLKKEHAQLKKTECLKQTEKKQQKSYQKLGFKLSNKNETTCHMTNKKHHLLTCRYCYKVQEESWQITYYC